MILINVMPLLMFATRRSGNAPPKAGTKYCRNHSLGAYINFIKFDLPMLRMLNYVEVGIPGFLSDHPFE